jgi:hypothetical protein
VYITRAKLPNTACPLSSVVSGSESMNQQPRAATTAGVADAASETSTITATTLASFLMHPYSMRAEGFAANLHCSGGGATATEAHHHTTHRHMHDGSGSGDAVGIGCDIHYQSNDQLMDSVMTNATARRSGARVGGEAGSFPAVEGSGTGRDRGSSTPYDGSCGASVVMAPGDSGSYGPMDTSRIIVSAAVPQITFACADGWGWRFFFRACAFVCAQACTHARERACWFRVCRTSHLRGQRSET